MSDPDSDQMICYCMGVPRSRLEQAVREQGARSVEDLQRLTYACGGCGTCRWDVEAVLKQVLEQVEADQ